MSIVIRKFCTRGGRLVSLCLSRQRHPGCGASPDTWGALTVFTPEFLLGDRGELYPRLATLFPLFSRWGSFQTAKQLIFAVYAITGAGSREELPATSSEPPEVLLSKFLVAKEHPYLTSDLNG